jgi:hypothetical protein
MSSQPKWKLVAQLGDANPVDCGGYFIYEDETGAYAPEGEKLFVDECVPHANAWTVYRFPLDRLKIDGAYLIPFAYDVHTYPHPVSRYDEWFHDDLNRVASYSGIALAQLRAMFCSANTIDRARAYETIGDYFGFDNLDSYPLRFTNRAEIEQRVSRARKESE